MYSFYEEFKNYQIPTNDIELLDWLIKGDPASTKEGWNFYIRCIFSSVEFARLNAPLRSLFTQIKGKTCTSYSVDEEECVDYLGNHYTYPATGINKFLPCEKELLDFINGEDLSIIEQVRDFAKICTVPNAEEFYASKYASFTSGDIVSERHLIEVCAPDAAKIISQAFLSSYEYIEERKREIQKEENSINTNKDILNYLTDLNIDTKEAKKILKAYRINGLTKKIRKKQFEKLLNKYKSIIEDSSVKITNYKKEIDEYTKYTFGENLKKKLNEKLKTARELSKMKSSDINETIKYTILLNEPYLQSIINLILTHNNLTYRDYGNIFLRLNELIKKQNSFPQYTVKEFTSEIRSNAYIFQQLFSSKIMLETNLEELSQNIRKLMIDANLTSEATLTTTYRDTFISNNDGYISGAHLTKEEISIEIKKLAEKFNIVQQNNDINEYVEECINIFHDYIRLHPYIDGNGRCSRMLLQVMLAKRGIYLPSLYDTHFDCIRDMVPGTFRFCGNQAIKTGDNSDLIAYIFNRVNTFYPNLLQRKNDTNKIQPVSSYNYNPNESQLFISNEYEFADNSEEIPRHAR